MPESRKQAYYYGLIWFVYTVLGILIPAGIGALFIAALNRLAVSDFTDGGQFGIYSAGLLISTLFLIAKPTSLRLPRTEWLLWFVILGFSFATLFFALGRLYVKGEDVNAAIFRFPSVALFVLSLFAALYAVVNDQLRSQPDPIRARQTEQDQLKDEFSATDAPGGTS